MLTDIKINDNMELTQAATGDAPLAEGAEAYLQMLRLEALTQEGDLWFDASFGWGLGDFLQREDTELNRAEIEHRIRSKLAAHTEIDKASIQVSMERSEDLLTIIVRFLINGETTELTVNMNRVEVSIDAG